MLRMKPVAALALLALVLAAAMDVAVWAQDAPKTAPAKPATEMTKPAAAETKAAAGKMAGKMGGDWFMVTSTHTAEECLKALDEAAATDPSWLGKTYCGCMHGDHTCWTIVQAANAEAATNTLPAGMRATAKVQQVNKFTPEMIKAAHEKH